MNRIIIASIGILLLMGCGSKGDRGGILSGTITYKGKPINGALLRLFPPSGKGEIIPVPVSQEGTFHGSSIPPGEYKIVVQPSQVPPEAMQMKMPEMPKGKSMDPAKEAEMKQKFQQARGNEASTIEFPKKYKSVETTDLKCTISQGKKENLTLELND